MSFLKQMLSDNNGDVSSKRVMTFIAFLTFIELIQVNAFKGSTIDATMLTLLFTLIMGGQVLSTGESIASKDKTTSQTTTENTTIKNTIITPDPV